MSEIPVSEIPLEQLLDEIDREEEELRSQHDRLTEAEDEYEDVTSQLELEKLPTIEERIKQRRERIARLESKIKARTQAIDETYNRIALLQLRSPYPTQEILRLRRRIPRLQGWQTRQESSLTSLKGWNTREERFVERQQKLLTERAYWIGQIREINMNVAHEEERLEEKRKRGKMIQAEITLVSITDSIKKGRKYKKRFQGFYLIDAIRDPQTGLFDMNAPLTQIELATCIDDFYHRWDWINEDGEPELPINTTEPRLTDISQFDIITEAQGAWFLSCSVISEEEGEEQFGNKEKIYYPTPEEKEEFQKHAVGNI